MCKLQQPGTTTGADHCCCLLSDLRPGAAGSQLIEQLLGATRVVQTHLVPHLSLAALQSLGQACRAMRAVTADLPPCQLWQLMQVWYRSLDTACSRVDA